MSVCQDASVGNGDHGERGAHEPRAPEAPAPLPPAQRPARGWPVVHYGPVPRNRPDTWDLRVFGATASGDELRLDLEELAALPRSTVRSDMHCVTKWTVRDLDWGGVLTSTLLGLEPPADAVRHVMVWAEYGYSANLPLAAFADPGTVLATHVGGEPLTPEHGWPLRLVCPSLYAWKSAKWVRAIEYLVEDRRGFWEERGYHNHADPWRDERYSYQE
jgi:DMSO/TMAO reductase YedYZ molybdopterin-dependent catalytic subunit